MNMEAITKSTENTCPSCGKLAYCLAWDIGFQIKHEAGCPQIIVERKKERRELVFSLVIMTGFVSLMTGITLTLIYFY